MDSRSKEATQVPKTLIDKSNKALSTDSKESANKNNKNSAEPDSGGFQTVQTDYMAELAKREKLLSTGEAAIALGLSKSEFKRREARGIYVPTYVAVNGWHFFSPEYLVTLPGYGSTAKDNSGRLKSDAKSEISTAVSIRKNGYASEEASRIFQALDEGMSSRDIVKTLLIHPDTMKVVYEAWKQLGTMEGGGIQISAKTLEAINELPLPGTYPITTEEQLLVNLRQASKDTPLCNVCHKLPCRLCAGCAEEVYSPPEPAPAKMGRPKKTA